jgi:hypothetical protein
VPPAAAREGTGAWAIVDSRSGAVVNSIVCNYSTCGTNSSYSEAIQRANPEYVFRYQGLGGMQEGLRWNESSGTFTHGSSQPAPSGGTVTHTTTVDPSKITHNSATNEYVGRAEGERHTTVYRNETGGQSVTAQVTTTKPGTAEQTQETVVTFPEWSGGKAKTYDSPARARANLSADVRADLEAEGYTVPGSGGAGGSVGAGGGGGAGGGSGAGGESDAGAVVAAGDESVADAGASDAPGDDSATDDSSDGDSGAGAGAGAGAGSDDVADGSDSEGATDHSTSEVEVPVFVQTILDLTDDVKEFLDDFFGWLGFGESEA